MSTKTCRWCKRRPATEHDHDTLPEGEDGGLCWREWNNWSDCHELEQSIKESAPDLLEALEETLSEMQALMDARAIPYQGGINIAEKARAAIARATGKEKP